MDYLERIGKPIPSGLNVSPRTTPVAFFGAYSAAKACTISINPSDREFFTRGRKLLSGKKLRLCSREILGKADNQTLSADDISIVQDYCENYFNINPYKAWFDKYEKFLEIFGFSYYRKSAVHLDLVQWATTPFWGKLEDTIKDKLLNDDLPFLKSLLSKNFEYIFLNGRTVMNEVQNHLNPKMIALEGVKYKGKDIDIYIGKYDCSNVIGWSPYLQSAAVGGFTNINELARLIKKISERNF